jgi:hypothetical protein
MSALSTIEAGLDQVSNKTKPGRRSGPALHLVTGSAPATSAPSRGPRSRVGAPPASPGARPSVGQRFPASRALPADVPAQSRRPDARPLRLTRRGRLVVGVFAVLLATIALSVAAMAAAGRAQASNHGRDGAGYQGMHQVVVQPGETLWAIASQAEPSADPRQVIAEIMTANSMTSTVVQAGELLWVPK